MKKHFSLTRSIFAFIFCLAVLSFSLSAGAAAAEPETVSPSGAASESSAVRAIPLTVSVINDWKDSEKTDKWVSMRVSQIMTAAEGYPDLTDSLYNYNYRAEKTARESMEELAKAMDEYGAEDDMNYFTESSLTVTRADTRVVSFCVLHGAYSGGAHPNSWYETHTYDSAGGRELFLDDILQNPEELPELLEEKLLSEIDRNALLVDNLAEAIRYEMHPDSEAADPAADEDSPSAAGPYFTLGYDSVTFWFAPYELTNYASGGVTTTLYFDDFPDLVKPEYREAPDDYISPVAAAQEYRLPGGRNLSWELTAVDESGGTELSVSCGDASTAEKDIYAFDAEAWLLHRSDRNYLICELQEEGDYSELHVFDLNDPSGIPGPEVISRHFADSCPTDPDRVRLNHRVNLLSTWQAGRLFRLTGEGAAEPLEAWDTYVDLSFGGYQLSLVTKQAFDADTVDYDTGEITGSVTIPSGSGLWFLRTDSESWVDMTMEDGTLVRLATKEEWPPHANGLPAVDLFEELHFAS